MKFPTATVALVSAALLYVLWDQTREQPAPLDASRFGNLSEQPVQRGEVLDWVSGQVPSLCREATGQPDDSEAVADCVERSDAYQGTCRRAAHERFPESIRSDQTFRELSLSMMSCLIRQSKPVGSG